MKSLFGLKNHLNLRSQIEIVIVILGLEILFSSLKITLENGHAICIFDN